jgi:hypothetical protein
MLLSLVAAHVTLARYPSISSSRVWAASGLTLVFAVGMHRLFSTGATAGVASLTVLTLVWFVSAGLSWIVTFRRRSIRTLVRQRFRREGT